jgi:YD repeat-containing protein
MATAARSEPIAETIVTIESSLARESAAIVGGHVSPLWLTDGSRFVYADEGPGNPAAVLVDPASGSVRRLCDDVQVRGALAAATGGSPGGITPRLAGLRDADLALYYAIDGRTFAVDRSCRSAQAAPDRDAANRRTEPRVINHQFPTTFGDLVEARSPDGRRFVTVHDHNLALRRAGEESTTPLTTDGSERLTWLNTQESAQSFNVYWAPDSRHVAAIQLDTRDVWYEPLPHWLSAHPWSEYVAYPRAGEPMHGFRLWVIDTDTGARVRLDTGDTKDHYVDIVGWRADGGAVYYQIVDRELKGITLLTADAATGRSTVVLRETRDTYVDTPMTLGIRFVFPLDRQNGFVYLSDRDGWRHLYLYDAAGRLIRRLTSGSWPVEKVVTVDERDGYVYFLAGQDPKAPYDLQLYRVALSGGRSQLLTDGTGLNDVTMSPSGRWFLTERSAPESAPAVELRAANGRLVRVLSQARIDGLAALGYSGTDRFDTKSLDGRFDMHGIVAKPSHFDPLAKYPVVEIIYGGMQSVDTPYDFYAKSMGSAAILHSLTDAGFVVVSMDAPGTPGRGRVFQDATYGIWPQTVIANHAHWIREAAAMRPWMDLRRVGLYGHSWGAYMAVRAMIDAPDLYKVAAAHAGPADFVDHSTYIEPFLGLPIRNPGAYEAGSNLARVGAILGPVLVMAGPLDVNAGFTPSMKLVDAMIAARKDVDLVILPESNHRLNCCGRDREMYAVAVIQRYFRRNLQNGRELP